MNLSTHFTLEEFTTSQTAERKNIDNRPTPEIVSSLKALCANTLEPIHDKAMKQFAAMPVGSWKGVHISSGYRCAALNKAIGGASNSQHVEGKAADITVSGMTVEQLYQLIKLSDIPFDQLIQEFNQWVHVSFNGNQNRRQCLRAVKVNGKTQYNKD